MKVTRETLREGQRIRHTAQYNIITRYETKILCFMQIATENDVISRYAYMYMLLNHYLYEPPLLLTINTGHLANLHKASTHVHLHRCSAYIVSLLPGYKRSVDV